MRKQPPVTKTQGQVSKKPDTAVKLNTATSNIVKNAKPAESIKPHKQAKVAETKSQPTGSRGSNSVKTEKIGGIVTLTVQDSEGNVILEHPPKKSVIYNAALDNKARIHELSKKV